ncbi:MAG: bifunctional metallophosphatase/5'-nucleotidase [Bacteroidales bacterium]|jgi:5'-nucleotidase|nr:bifunctional metallophosphatase/5'-nucleotidase [Bacteroidales bacterium]
MMKKSFTFFFLAFFFIPLAAQQERKIVILHTNDIHSRVTGYAPEASYTPLTVNDDNTVGGFARIATVIKEEKDKNKDINLVLDAGDFLMGTLFQALETTTGFQLGLMNDMGYDVVCLGNHEFDYGPEKLSEIVSSAKKRGEIPATLLSNAQFDKNDPGDNSLEQLFSDGTIKRKFILEKGGLKFGFFSLMGVEADDNAAFAPPVTFSKQIPAAKKLVKELRDEKCDLIICLSHSGVKKDKNGKWKGEDFNLAKKVKGIDVIISGHSHTELEEPLIVNGIPVVQAGVNGQYVGKLSLTYNNGIVTVDGYSLIPVNDRIEGDPGINQMVEDQKKEITKKILSPLGLDYEKTVTETDFLLECVELGDIKGSNLGPMVADAIHKYVNNHVKPGTDISMVAVGVIRDKFVPGLQSAPDVFRVMSMGNGNDNVPGYPLARAFLTGKELKKALEVLQIAYKSTPGNYCYYSGLRVEFDPKKGLLRKISKITIIHPDGTSANVDFSKNNKTLYSIAASSYMLENVSIIKKMSFGLINVVLKDAMGNPITVMKDAIIDFDESREGLQEGKEWLALMEYLSSMKDSNGNGIPDIDKRYKEAIQSFFTVKK